MLPTLYISHGSPMLALEPSANGVQLRHLATELPRPKMILVISVYQESDDLRVTGAAAPDIWRDFYGFPPPLYAVCYPAKGAPAPTRRTVELLQAAGLPAQADSQQPFDHGAWVPLSLMYSQADIPMLQLSLPSRLGPALRDRIDQALHQPRGEGVLLVGSGSITHDPGELDWHAGPKATAPWTREFRDWMVGKLQVDDKATLHGYRRQALWAARSHPSDEYPMPLFFAHNAGSSGMRVEHSGFTLSSLEMDIYRFDWRNFSWDWRKALASHRKLGGPG